jgi:hypothetical protein
MRTVHKYPFQVDSTVVLNLPRGAEVLHVACRDDGMPCLWALVDDENKKEPRTFLVIATGKPVPGPRNALRHVATFFEVPDVWHLFEPWHG